LNSRYYNPEIGRFINADGLLGELGNIQSTNMYAYCANNPVMYSDITGFTPEWIEDIGRFFGGTVITIISVVSTVATSLLFLIPGASTIPLFTINMTAYGAMLMASPFSNTIKSDMSLIAWNPFNGDVNAVVSSKDISFYKGVFTFRYGSSGGGGISFGFIGLGRGASVNTVMHEYGHHKQQRLMGLAFYTPIVAIPSLISAASSTYGSHANRWYERWATKWGNRSWIWW
ncbi:MAG: RHS repeat-associated core domain-containing protein, partial [Bacilli bacterium]|nr:RHS repeat-associated core domain-containing protein [Bacilli bacterium]